MSSEPPVDPHRSGLYTPGELYDTPRYADSLDARAYAWARRRSSGRVRAEDHMARALHDLAIDEALDEWRRRRRVVGVMGAHAAQRGEPVYADAVRLGHALGQQHVVATGGGPGAMEAANLGGLMSHEPSAALADAVGELATVPAFRPVDDWLRPALAVRERVRQPQASLGIPTWFYGQEPSNVFATAIAKYFRNAIREAILLEVCDAGIVFLPGVGGTIQEVFQDACENYYAEEEAVAEMVLVGREYWGETLPAWPLLRAMARGRPMEGHVHLVETIEDAVALLSGPS